MIRAMRCRRIDWPNGPLIELIEESIEQSIDLNRSKCIRMHPIQINAYESICWSPKKWRQKSFWRRRITPGLAGVSNLWEWLVIEPRNRWLLKPTFVGRSSDVRQTFVGRPSDVRCIDDFCNGQSSGGRRTFVGRPFGVRQTFVGH